MSHSASGRCDKPEQSRARRSQFLRRGRADRLRLLRHGVSGQEPVAAGGDRLCTDDRHIEQPSQPDPRWRRGAAWHCRSWARGFAAVPDCGETRGLSRAVGTRSGKFADWSGIAAISWALVGQAALSERIGRNAGARILVVRPARYWAAVCHSGAFICVSNHHLLLPWLARVAAMRAPYHRSEHPTLGTREESLRADRAERLLVRVLL